jgi:hypothetical protein
MKAIATLAVLGLAYAGERRENPRFRIDSKVVTANNNKDVLNIDFSKDIPNMPGVQTSIISKDLKDLIPAGFRDLVKDVKIDHRVFTAQNNNGVLNINMDDADNELIGVTWKHKDINGDHNSGRMDININNDDADSELIILPKPNKPWNPDLLRMYVADDELIYIPGKQWGPGLHVMDDADNELRSTTKVHANDNRGMMQIMGNDDELFLDLHNTHTHVNADHNSGMMNVNINNDDELMMLPRWRTDIRRPVAEADDELFLDLTNKHTHVNANHNSGMMNIRINNDDADNELASWRTDNIYFPKKQDGLDYVHVKTETQVNSFAGNTGVRIIQRDDADDELVYIPGKQITQGSYHIMDDADDELVYIPGKQITQGFYHIMDDADNELRSTVHANDNRGMMQVMGNDDELFLDFTNKHNHVNANHNSGMMNIHINNDDELMVVPKWRNDIRRPVVSAEADDELFLDFTNKHNHVNANHNSGMMNIHINNDDADNELMQLGALLKSLKEKKTANN